MADCMTFPEDWRDFLRDYSFRDSEEVYTNGSELIPVFRVEQLIEHLLKTREPMEMTPKEAHAKLEKYGIPKYYLYSCAGWEEVSGDD